MQCCTARHRRRVLGTVGILLGLAAVTGCGGSSAESTRTPTSPSAEPTAVATAPTLTDDMILSAQIPSICDFPAGPLVNGNLNGVEPGSPAGGVWLDPASIIHGELAESNTPAVAVGVFTCDQGGVAWPQVIGVFTADDSRSNDGKAPAATTLATIELFPLTNFGRESVEDIQFENGKISIRWWTGVDGDSAAEGDSAASAIFAWNGTGFDAEGLTVRTASDTAQSFLDRLNAGDISGAQEYITDPDIAGDVEKLVNDGEKISALNASDCSHDGPMVWSCTFIAVTDAASDAAWFGYMKWENRGWDVWTLTQLHTSWD
jgi:hypothetical protein